MKDSEALKKSILAACKWLTDVAQIKEQNLPSEQNPRGIEYPNWQGAIRGEYTAATRAWDTFCPMWHTGQAVKALVMAWEQFKDAELLEAAELAGKFLMNNQVDDPGDKDYGLLVCYEGTPGESNSSAVLESLDGIFHLYEATGNEDYKHCAIKALNWLKNNAYKDKLGHFRDFYYPARREWDVYDDPEVDWEKGRPLLDDAIFLKAWKYNGDDSFKNIALETAEALLTNEYPAGNWINYAPCVASKQSIHPRHAYWWGLPMLEVYKETGDERFFECFKRSVEWYKEALRKDGGFIRSTYVDFKTSSFNHATSGSACAVISFIEYYRQTKDESILEYIEMGLGYCMKMQLLDTKDPNLSGVILEKVLPPNGTDQSPYHIRDLGTIFYIQAACLYMKVFGGNLK